MKDSNLTLTLRQSRLIKFQMSKGDSLKANPEAQWTAKGYQMNEMFSSPLFQSYDIPTLEMFKLIFDRYGSVLIVAKRKPTCTNAKQANRIAIKMRPLM